MNYPGTNNALDTEEGTRARVRSATPDRPQRLVGIAQQVARQREEAYLHTRSNTRKNSTVTQLKYTIEMHKNIR